MTRTEGKKHFWVHRNAGGLRGNQLVLLGPDVVAVIGPDVITLVDKDALMLRGWGALVKVGWLKKDDPYCFGLLEISDKTSRFIIHTSGTPFSADYVVWLIRTAFSDNRDPARYCGNPAIFIDGQAHGFAK